MISTVFLILASFNLFNNDDQCYISDLKIKNKRSLIFYYQDENDQYCYSEKLRIKKINNKRFFKYKDESIYLDVDSIPKPKFDLCALFKMNENDLDSFYMHNPVVTVTFIVNANGVVLDLGIIKPDSENFYNRFSLSKLENLLNSNLFSPGILNGRAVGSMYSLAIFYSNSQCQLIQL